MATLIEGVVARVERADTHLGTLKASVENFTSRKLYRVRSHQYRATTTWRPCSAAEVVEWRLANTRGLRQTGLATFHFGMDTVYSRVTIDLEEEPPLLEWALTVGDVIHNLRSALDNLVWALTVKHSGPPPASPLPAGPWRRVQFPIALNRLEWKGGTGYPGMPEIRRLWGINPRLVGRFNRLQPFHRRQAKTARRHWLSVLNELANIDKHRAVPVVNHLLGLDTLGLYAQQRNEVTARFPEDVEAKLFKPRGQEPFRSGDEVARYRFALRRPNELLARALAEGGLEVRFNGSVSLAFETGPPAHGAPVLETLEEFVRRTRAVLEEFGPYC